MAGFFCSAVVEDRQCVVCSTPITHPNKRTRTCGKVCGKVLSDRTRGENARIRNERSCLRCGRTFQKQRNAPGYFCSTACVADAQRIYPDERAAKRAGHQRARKRQGLPELMVAACDACGSPFLQKNHRNRLCSDPCRVADHERRRLDREKGAFSPATFQCMECGQPHTTEYGHPFTVYCSAQCGRISARRREKLIRKARVRQAHVEPVDPMRVFERDGWRCHLCGIKTPRKLRGTVDQQAPELDHIVPLAKGGDHSYRNVACACRRCNGAKADTIKGQMLLFG